jgi:hypothetical protein
MAYNARFDRYRSFGIELEVVNGDQHRFLELMHAEGIAVQAVGYTHAVVDYWKCTTDGSLSGYGAMEVVSPVLTGEEGLNEVRKVVKLLAQAGYRTNRTCGFHVHWNVADFTGKNVQSLLRLYAKFENVIDYLVSPSRRGNNNDYCQSMVKDGDLSWVTRLARNEGRDTARTIADQFAHHYRSAGRASRYHKVNVTAYPLYGTIEFRQHQGTVNHEKVISWILFTQQLVNKSKEVSVSKQVSAKPTLGELLRILRLPPHVDGEVLPQDPVLEGLKDRIKRRYAEFREGLGDEE